MLPATILPPQSRLSSSDRMDIRMPFRRTSDTSSSSDSPFKPFISSNGHIGTDVELYDTPPRAREIREAMNLSSTNRVKQKVSRSGTASSPTTNLSGESSPTQPTTHESKGKGKIWSPPPPISSSIYGSMNPITSIIPPTKPSSSQSRTQSMTSSYRHVTFGPTTHGAVHDPLLILSQREQEIHKEIQGLLDAQSDGLQAGLGGGGDTSASASVMSEGSNTPTMSRSAKMPPQFIDDKYSSMVVRPVRQPKKKKPSLRAARRGILHSISELVNLKAEEDAIVSADISFKRSTLQNIDSWERKMSGFQKAIEETSKTEEARELQTLQSEKQAVETEIQELETRLQQMHAKQRNLGHRISELENRQEAGVSSYKEGLRLAKKNVEIFLNATDHGGPGDGTGFWALPRKRRTLGLAREHYTEELESSRALRSQILVEGQALIEGADVWADATKEILAWEINLRKALSSPADEQEGLLSGVLKELNDLIVGLEKDEQVADEKGWKLLIVAIGAELAYLKEGRGVLQNILGVLDAPQDNDLLARTLTREDTNGFNESFRTAEDGTGDSAILHGHHHGLSELDTDLTANTNPLSNSTHGESENEPPVRSSSSPSNSLPNSIIKANPRDDRMIASTNGSSLFKNGSLPSSKNIDNGNISPPQNQSPNGTSRGTTPLLMSPRFEGGRGNTGFFSPDRMTGNGRLTMSWRDKGKGKLGQKMGSSDDESEDEGPDPELLVGSLGEDVE